jgi:hypothetical protein
VHVTIVGPKDDPRSAALYAAALRYPLADKRDEWWDKREGQLVHHDVDYPDFPDGPAAFACTRNFCSLPVTDPAAIPEQLDRLQRAMPKSGDSPLRPVQRTPHAEERAQRASRSMGNSKSGSHPSRRGPADRSSG